MSERAEIPEFPAQRGNDYRDVWAGQIRADRVGTDARLAGWVNRRRDHGGLVFIDLRDRTGVVQLVFDPDDAGTAFELGHRLRSEDVISVRGPVVERSPDTVNPEIPTGAWEVRVSDAELLADATTPPFQIEGAAAARRARRRGCATGTSTSAASRCVRPCSFAPASSGRCASTSTARGSSRSRRRS